MIFSSVPNVSCMSPSCESRCRPIVERGATCGASFVGGSRCKINPTKSRVRSYVLKTNSIDFNQIKAMSDNEAWEN